jgi:hypothetical protein
MKKPPSVGSAALPDRVTGGDNDREDAAKGLRSKADSQRPPATQWQRGYFLPVWCLACQGVHEVEVCLLPGRPGRWAPTRLLAEHAGDA